MTETKTSSRSYATGRRKESVARVWLTPGEGKFTVNGRAFEDYFPAPTRRMNPPRARSLWEGASASEGASLAVGMRVFDHVWMTPRRVVEMGEGASRVSGGAVWVMVGSV